MGTAVEPSSEVIDIAESVTDGLLSIAPDWTLRYVNSAFEAMVSVHRADVVGTALWASFPALAGTELERQMRGAMADRMPRALDYYSPSVKRWFETHIRPARDGGLLLCLRDITGSKRTIEALRDSQEWLALAQASVDVGFWEWDARTESTTASEGYYRLYGLKPGTPIPHYREWLSTIHSDDRPRVVKALRAVFDGERKFDAEFRIAGPDGNYRWMLSKATAFFDGSGHILRMMGVNIDITGAKQARELARSNVELERFAYSASHDLRDPLRAIRACAKSLEQRSGDSLDADGRDLVRVIDDSARRMIAITEGLLNYATLGGADVLKREHISMNTVFDWALVHLRQLIGKSGATVERGDLPDIDANQAQMIQLMQNLLSNAVKYRAADRKPAIRVEARPAAGGWQFSVIDNGAGMKPGFEASIFRLFGRLEGRNGGGAGIGLATCRKIVENHGGRIWAESTHGEGSTFHFTLPQ